MNDTRLRSEALLKFEGYNRCTDNRFILYTGCQRVTLSGQTAKQMRDLRFKFEITLERLKYSQRNATYNSVG